MSFDIIYIDGLFALTYKEDEDSDVQAIDTFRQVEFARKHFRIVEKYERENPEYCPVHYYNITFNPSEKMEEMAKRKAARDKKNDSRNERARRREERSRNVRVRKRNPVGF